MGRGTNANGETYDGDDESNPHEEVETSENVVGGLEPVLGGRGANDIFPIFQSTFDGGRLEPDGGTARVANTDLVGWDKVDIDSGNGVCGIYGLFGLGVACNLFIHPD